jgi:hypothetical protein
MIQISNEWVIGTGGHELRGIRDPGDTGSGRGRRPAQEDIRWRRIQRPDFSRIGGSAPPAASGVM